MPAPREGERVEIGVVARAHGLRGEILVVTHDPASETLGDVDRVWLGERSYEVRGARPSNHGWLMDLDGIETRTDAETLRGARVSVPRDTIELADGEFLLGDLVGCRVVRTDGAPCGEIVALHTGGQTRLVIHDDAVERLVPLVDALVPSIDLEARVVTVAIDADWPTSPVASRS